MLKTILSTGVAVSILLLEGCALETAASADHRGVPGGQTAPPPQRAGTGLEPALALSGFRHPDDGLPKASRGPKPGISYRPVPVDISEVPTGLLLATCENEPEEVAVPLNAADHKFCDHVRAIAFREDRSGTYEVSTDYAWSVEEPEVVALVPSAKPAGQVRRLSAMYDLFSVPDRWTEPQTEITVCAVPRSENPLWDLPICRTLPVRAVVNLEGAWCFQGETFDAVCTDVTLRQDGRGIYLDSEPITPTGEVRNRLVRFTRLGHDYKGFLDDNDHLYGIVRGHGQSEVLGAWTAWRLPLF